MLIASHPIIVGLGIAALLARQLSLSVFSVNKMTGMGLALGIDHSLFMISRFHPDLLATLVALVEQHKAIRANQHAITG